MLACGRGDLASVHPSFASRLLHTSHGKPNAQPLAHLYAILCIEPSIRHMAATSLQNLCWQGLAQDRCGIVPLLRALLPFPPFHRLSCYPRSTGYPWVCTMLARGSYPHHQAGQGGTLCALSGARKLVALLPLRGSVLRPVRSITFTTPAIATGASSVSKSKRCIAITGHHCRSSRSQHS